ncbi:hypothetical protein M9Y10_004365 [Tritrichomonas musculus]|uniref:Protein kinase domain-containing protein n=1 Tax=Tritrichomonas musculus TaxID=1915356 RepID=A0ABR2JRV6_9EUKA
MSEVVFPLNPDQYDLLYQIGQGPFTKVFLARCHTNGRLIAAKLMNIDSCEFNYALMKKEMVFWQQYDNDHPNVAKFYGSFLHESTMWILQEYIDGGSIYDIIHFGYIHGFKGEPLIATIIREVLQFLAYFHKKEQIHRHLQSSSVLITSKGEVKVTDYGYSAGLFDIGDKKNTRFIILGTACYTPPELITDAGYKESLDIWSLGIIAIELAHGMAPHSELTPMEQIIAIIGESPPGLQDRYSAQFRDFVSLCLQKNPANRPSALELLKHPFIRKGLECSYIEKVLMSSLPPLDKRFGAMMANLEASKVPFAGHENPVYFKFEINDIEENGSQNPENLVKTQVGKLFLTIKEPKVIPIEECLNKSEKVLSAPPSPSNADKIRQEAKQMSLDDIVSKVTEMEMQLETIAIDNFQLNQQIGHYSKVIKDMKEENKKA